MVTIEKNIFAARISTIYEVNYSIRITMIKHLWLMACMLLMMVCVSSMSAQTKVTGNVVNERGETVEYV